MSDQLSSKMDVLAPTRAKIRDSYYIQKPICQYVGGQA